MSEVTAKADATIGGPQFDAKRRGVLFGLRGLGCSGPMRRRTIAIGIYCLSMLCLSRQAVAGALLATQVQTQSTGAMTATNWGPGTIGINDPPVFNQFDPKLGTLISIDLTLTSNIRNDYTMDFVSTQIMTTIDLATSETTDPNVLADPAKRALLTDGPTVTLFGPNGVTPLLTTTQPVDFVQLTKPGGMYSSTLPNTDPNFIQPTITQLSTTRTLTAADAPSLFSEFIGAGSVDLSVDATAFSSYLSSSGNGGGMVVTKADATVMIQFNFLPVPEPSSVVLLGLGIGVSVLASEGCVAVRNVRLKTRIKIQPYHRLSSARIVTGRRTIVPLLIRF